MIERAVVLTAGTTIGPDLIPDSVRGSQSFQLPNFELPAEGIPFRQVVDDLESMLITRALDAAGGVQKRAAALLQVKPTTLNEMLKRHGIRPRRRGRSGKGAASSPSGERQSSVEKKRATPGDLADMIGRRLTN